MSYLEQLDAPQETQSANTANNLDLLSDKKTALAIAKSGPKPADTSGTGHLAVPAIPGYTQPEYTVAHPAATAKQPAESLANPPAKAQAAATNPMTQLQTDSTNLSKAEAALTKDAAGSAQFKADEQTMRKDAQAVVVDMDNIKSLHPTDPIYNKTWTTARTDLASTNSNLWNLENRQTNSADYKQALTELKQNEPKFQSDLPAVYNADQADSKTTSGGLGNTVLGVPNAAAINDAVKAGLTFGTVRLWDDGVKMDQLENNPKAWNTLQNLTDASHAAGKQVMYTFGESGSSPYVPTDASVDAFTKKLTQWSAQQKADGKGGIDTYELWNEPSYHGYWKGTPEQLAHINAIMIQDIKKYDPTAKIASPALSFDASAKSVTSFDDSYFAAMGKMGMNQDFNQIDFHGYGQGASQPPEKFVNDVAVMKQIENQFGLQKDPLVDSEDSFGKTSWLPNQQDQANYLARKMIEAEYSGVTPGWYGYGFKPWGSLTTDGKPGGPPTQAVEAWQQVDKWLNGAQLENLNQNGDVWTATLMRNGKQETVAWAESGTASYTPPSGYSQYQTLDGTTKSFTGPLTLTGEPILLES